MAKVIVERPRRGDPARARKGRTRPLEDEDGAPLRARAPVRRAEKTKSLNENLAPLRRFLEGQVGRPWDKVYAEISEHLRATNTVQQHVRDHVEDFVAVKTRMQDGKVIVAGRRFRGGETGLADAGQKLYVHPRTGLLRKNTQWRRWDVTFKEARAAEKAARAGRLREVSAGVQLHLLNDGAWWEVRLGRIKQHSRFVTNARGKRESQTFDEPHDDVVLRTQLSDLPRAELYGRDGVYAIEKRQLSKAEKKKLGLA